MSPPSGHECLRARLRAGFMVLRQTGSHVRLQGPTGQHVTVAIHARRPLPPKTYASILDQAGLTDAQLRALL